MAEDGIPRRRGLGQLIGDGVGDLGALLRFVPEIAGYLRTLVAHTAHMDQEVTGMHAAVVRLEGEVRQLRETMLLLDERMGTVGDAVVRLEPQIESVNLAIRPLRRARTVLGPRRPPDPPPPT